MRATTWAAAFGVAALLAGGAAAQDLPAGVHVAGAGLVDGRGLPLYTFKWDTMKGMSHCEGSCAKAWPPLVAAPDAKPSGDWSIIERDDGSHQWALKDKPLYVYAKDTQDQPATGVSQNWSLAH